MFVFCWVWRWNRNQKIFGDPKNRWELREKKWFWESNICNQLTFTWCPSTLFWYCSTFFLKHCHLILILLFHKTFLQQKEHLYMFQGCFLSFMFLLFCVTRKPFFVWAECKLGKKIREQQISKKLLNQNESCQ